jgi:hypothetical protein
MRRPGLGAERLALRTTDIIHEVLTALRRAAGRERAAEASGLAAASFLGATGVALLLSQLGAPRVGLALVVLVTLAMVALVVVSWRRTRELRPLAAAALAETLAPELGTSARSAVDLAETLARGRVDFSRDLAELHLDRTALRLQEAPLVARLAAAAGPRRKRALLLVGAAALTTLVLATLLDTGRARLGAILFDPAGALVSDLPLAGDISLTYRYPAYTRLPPRMVAGGDGSISAVIGTEVDLAATADRDVRSALLRVVDADGNPLNAVPLTAADSRKLSGRLLVLRDARYRFALVDDDGERVEERSSRSIHAQLDEYPEVSLDAPLTDLELKDDAKIDLVWHARDDFGVALVQLVIQREGKSEPERVKLATESDILVRREGKRALTAAELNIAPGGSVSLYVEVIDNDTVSGPKRSVSPTRRVSLFSARKEHEALTGRERAVVDALVDWLGADLVSPVLRRAPDAGAVEKQRLVVGRMFTLATELRSLTLALKEDKLTSPEVTQAFRNLMERVTTAHADRSRAVLGLGKGGDAAVVRLSELQGRQVTQLERDIIYFDDLLALQKIEELKSTAKDLLAAQRELQTLLQKYRETQDPALKAMLEQQIKDLRQQMMDLLQKMASIKQTLPGEYRNMEAATMLKLDEQLDRLEELLKAGDLDRAGAALEELASMVENMVNSIDKAEEEFGGERYGELKKKLADFANHFKELESEQQALAKRAQELTASYRKRAIDKAGKSLDDFVKKTRKKTAEAMTELDKLATNPESYPALDKALGDARQRVSDLDALLENRDFSEARDVGDQAEEETQAVDDLMQQLSQWSGKKAGAKLKENERASGEAAKKIREVNEMLDRLFPDAGAVMSKSERDEMMRMAKKQEALEKRAAELGQKMDELSEEMPLFGGEPKQSLENAESEMNDAASSLREGQLPQAAQHKRRAADELGKLRAALEKASKKGGGKGIPLPLGMSQGNKGGDGEMSKEEVEIPQADKNRADPRFRKELMDAAKQRAPDRYEDAVRKYYEELVR